MKWRSAALWGALGILSLTGFASSRDPAKAVVEGKKPDFLDGTLVWLEGNSSLHRYYFTATGITAKTNLSTSDSKVKSLLSLILNRKGQKLTVAFPVEDLKSGDKGMDQNAYEKLKAKDNPDIVFSLVDYVVKAFPGSHTPYSLLVSGKLRIAGVEKDVNLEPTLVWGKDGIRIYGSQDI